MTILRYPIFASTNLWLALAACGGNSDTSTGGAGGTANTTTSTGGASSSSSSSSGSTVDCSQTTTKIEESAKARYPTGANRTGALVSSLSADKQALVTAAIEGWVRNFEASSIADELVADYTSATAYADTYVAFAGSSSTGVDVDTSGTYMRIDGPRVWIEVACQGGVVIQGKTHYHTIYRDKQFDYGGSI